MKTEMDGFGIRFRKNRFVPVEHGGMCRGHRKARGFTTQEQSDDSEFSIFVYPLLA